MTHPDDSVSNYSSSIFIHHNFFYMSDFGNFTENVGYISAFLFVFFFYLQCLGTENHMAILDNTLVLNHSFLDHNLFIIKATLEIVDIGKERKKTDTNNVDGFTHSKHVQKSDPSMFCVK